MQRRAVTGIIKRYASTQATTTTTTTYKPLPDGWEAVIGVEVHAQLKTNVKLFSDTPMPDDRRTSPSPENSCVSAFDAALPGTLPRLQRPALALALRACLALQCNVSKVITFDRKHYFYPDLPSGFQISQKYFPLARQGVLRLLPEDGQQVGVTEALDVRIEQIQLEQDTAKSLRRVGESSDATVINLNRANAPLIEIVSGPDMRTPEQTGAYIRKLRETLRRIGASDGNMDEGSMRCDVNVSVHRRNEPWGVRCEVKNVSSIKFAMNAVVHEMHRQHDLLEHGHAVEQETRGYDEQNGTTFRLRTKEDAPDYRYMPDANLPPLRIDETMLHDVRQSLPELPDAQRVRLMDQYGIGVREVNVLMRISDHAVAYFEEVAKGRDGRMVINWLIHELLKSLNAHDKSFSQNSVSATHFGQLLDLVQEGKVTKSTAKELLTELVVSQCDFSDVQTLLRSRNALAMDSADELSTICKEVVKALPDAVDAVRNGNEKVLQRLIGEVMRRTKGRANAKLAGDLLRQLVYL